MAQVDVQWPSEDEDFDATIDNKNNDQATATATTEQPPTLSEEPASEPALNEASSEATSESPASEPSVQAEAAPEPQSQPEPVAEQPAVPAAAQPKSPKNWVGIGRLVVEVALVAGVVGLLAMNMSLANEKKDVEQKLAAAEANPQALVQKQTDALIQKVAALMTLPQGEAPTVANVSDPEAAKKQSTFFKDAQKDDKVLMYVKAGQAILYRPSTNKIILVAPLTFNDAAGSTSDTTKPNTTTR